MGYLVKAGLGLILFFGSIVVFNVKLIELMEIGTCASGNTAFEIARPCPEGTGTNMLLVTGSIFTGLIGAAIFAFRGDPPWGRRKRAVGMFGLGSLAWGIFFTSTAVAMLYTGFSNDTVGPDGELAGKIVGFTFLIMGLPVLLFSLWNVVKGLGSGRDESPAAAGSPAMGPLGGGSGVLGKLSAGLGQAQEAQQTGQKMNWGSAGKPASGGGDAIGRIERLQKLRESGAITDAEFNREKSKILAEQ
jgi:hypothetical protein